MTREQMIEEMARRMNPMAFDDAVFAEPGGKGQLWAQEQSREAAAHAYSVIEGRMKELEEALEPFAKVADAFEYWCAEAMPSFSYPEQSCDLKFAREDCPNAVGELTASDFARARATLQQDQG